MKYLAIILALSVFALPFSAFATTGDSARFDFTQGVPTIVDNTTSTCNNMATVMYSFTQGVPTEVFDATATCTSSVTTPIAHQVLINNGARVIVTNGGQVIIQ